MSEEELLKEEHADHWPKTAIGELGTARAKLKIAEDLLKDLIDVKRKADGGVPTSANQGQAMDGYSELANYRAIIDKIKGQDV